MKVLIPVAGVGSKLKPHTNTQPKTLVPIAGKPILAHIVDSLIDWGFNEFIFVVGYLGEKIEDYLKEQYPDYDCQFVKQEPRQGLAHALWVSRNVLSIEKDLVIVLGDTIVNLNPEYLFNDEVTMLGVKKVSNPMSFGIVESDRDGKVLKLIEKPKIPKSNWALVGVYKIKNVPLLLNKIDYLITNQIKTNGEYHLTDALMEMVKDGENMKVFAVDNWIDCGKKESLLEANAILLNKDVFKKKVYNFPHTVIKPPVCIGANCVIENAIIGPNVAIGDHAIVQNSIIQNTIIGSHTELKDVVLDSSIIGNNSTLKGFSPSYNIGDNAEISFVQED